MKRPPMQAANPVEGHFGFVSGNVESVVLGVGALILITQQLRIRVAMDAIDGRKYAPSLAMRSLSFSTRRTGRSRAPNGA
jgi:hypothetical protein